MEKITGVFMRPHIDPLKKNNLLIPERTLRTYPVTKHDQATRGFFRAIDALFLRSGLVTTEKITIRTFLKVDQNLYGPGKEARQGRDLMTQEVLVKSYNGSEESARLKEPMQGFPLPMERVLRVPAG